MIAKWWRWLCYGQVTVRLVIDVPPPARSRAAQVPRDRWPFTGHRTMAEVIRDEARDGAA